MVRQDIKNQKLSA